ncbi:MAG: hypothetical protein LBE60_01815 [Microbacterium sp.]|jgi:hypothetical protein|uniref:hypothetical protein n=1 Tax=Microbacterium sp. TaxID=51671 RepID=UPI0028374B68|nr:hypothetical protein [Microbacterium sp.]MDR2320364.1 hypothetical protein [Microbacterium sp.]
MNRTARIVAWSAAGLVVIGFAVGAGSAFATVSAAIPQQAAQPSPAPSAPSRTPAPEPSAVFPTSEQERVGGAENCHPLARIEIQRDSVDVDGNAADFHGELIGEPIDFGPRRGATGTVNLDDQGRIVSYTTVTGDNLDGIEKRLCMDMTSTATYNRVGWAPGEHPWSIGDTFILRPDPTAAWIPGP